MKNIFAVFLLFSLNTFAQKQAIFRIDSLPKQGIVLDKNWKWHAGDNPDFARADFDDSKWESIDPMKDIFDLPQVSKKGDIFWLRLPFIFLDSTLNEVLIMTIQQSGASEIFLNGKLIQRIGVLSKDKSKIKAILTNREPFNLQIQPNRPQILAIRYAFQPNIFYGTHFANTNKVLSLEIVPLKTWYEKDKKAQLETQWNTVVGVIFATLCILYFAFYLFFLKQKINLYFTIYTALQVLPYGIFNGFYIIKYTENYYWIFNVMIIISVIASSFLLLAVYRLFNQKIGVFFLLIILLGIICIPAAFFIYDWGWVVYGVGFNFLFNFELFRIAIIGVLKNKKGAWFIASAGFIFCASWVLFLYFSNNDLESIASYFYALAQIAVPISVALKLGYDFAQTNHSLQQKLTEVEALSNEKQQILATQNETLEKQVLERTAELEHKNRDLEIEAALERVRSRSMAMHKSEELLEVIKVVFKELQNLGFKMENASFITNFQDEYWDFWQATPEYIYPTLIRIPYFDHPLFNKVKETLKQNIDLLVLKLNYDEKNEWWYHLFKHTIVNHISQERKKYLLKTDCLIFSAVFMKNIALAISNYDNHYYIDEENQILKRFGNSFDQAYTRFLDLQKAEAQVREARIEAALEKIRNRSLAMFHSGEIKDVVAILFEKLKELDLVFDGGAAIHLFTEGSRNAIIWVASPDLNEPSCINLPYDENAFENNPIIMDVWKAKESGEHIYNKFYTFDEKNRYFNYVFKHNDFTKTPEYVREFILQADSYTASFIAEKKSLLGANSWTRQLFSDNDFEVLKRIAKVFEQAYIRFLDLQKAEKQAREAQIEVALERVRSKTMAMQHSNELVQAANLMFNEIRGLGIPIWSCGYNIFENNGKSCIGWMSTEGSIQPSFNIPLKVSPTFIKFYESRKNGEELYEEKIGGTDLEKHYNYMLTLPKFAESLKIFFNAGYKLPTFQVNTVVNFAQGNLIFISAEPIPEAHEIFKRFAKVFEQTYTRFLDLQKAEAQSEQAKLDLIQIQTEKKRAEDALTILKATQAQLIQSEKLASLGELTAGIAHEIQNPLNFVNNFSELSRELIDEMNEEIEKGDTEEVKAIAGDLKQNLEKINYHGKRASSIVKGMLEHSRTSTGVKELTDINALADEYLRLSYHGLRAKDNTFNADFKTDFDKNLPKIAVIPQDFGRVLLNIINNAFYAVTSAASASLSRRNDYLPLVIISTRWLSEVETIEVSVQDNGTGMSEATKAKIFQPFFTTKPTGQGTGLGLSLAYDIVTKGHGGTLEVESNEGEGSEFMIKLSIQNI